ncbi:MAG TPA: hypothetical protein VGG16_19005, partial [Streptosporangiaceae bacterium]
MARDKNTGMAMSFVARVIKPGSRYWRCARGCGASLWRVLVIRVVCARGGVLVLAAMRVVVVWLWCGCGVVVVCYAGWLGGGLGGALATWGGASWLASRRRAALLGAEVELSAINAVNSLYAVEKVAVSSHFFRERAMFRVVRGLSAASRGWCE